MKYFYIAVQRKIESGYYAYFIRVSTSDNLVSKMKPFTAANICPTKRRAWELSEEWNRSFIENGTYAFRDLFDDNDEIPLF